MASEFNNSFARILKEFFSFEDLMPLAFTSGSFIGSPAIKQN